LPDFPIIDAHVHLYDPGAVPFGWMTSAPAIDSPHDIADFDAARGGVALDKYVFVEVAADAGAHMKEARWIAERAKADPRLAGLVLHAPLEKGVTVEADLEAMATMPKVKGVRRLIQGEADPGFCLEPGFAAGIELLPKYGFSFDICLKSFALTYGLELVRRHPAVSFVLDHIGKPDIRHGLVEPWRSQIRALASLPNVACKISGVITEAARGKDGSAHLRPYIIEVVEAFGFDRVMFGGDWPVSELTHRYRRWVDGLDAILADASASERERFYRLNAERTYRLGSQ
jgi:L-fuconolactonase